MAKTITGIKAGTTTITATYGGVTSNSVSFTVGKIDASLTFDVNSSPLIYDGTPKTLGTVSYDGDGQVKYYVSTSNSAPSASASGWVNCSDGTDVEATNAGTYYVFLQATEGTNYNAVAVKSGNTTGKQIAKATVPPTFSNTTVYANLNPTDFTTSPQVNCGAFTAATAGHSGGLTYALGTVKNSGGTTVTTGWSLNTSRVLTVPKSTPGGTYTATVTVTEAATSNYNSGTATATITIIVNKKDQVAPTATGASSTYATSGSITGSASGGGCTGNTINYKSDTNGGTSYGSATTTAPTRNRNSVGTTSFIAFWPGNNYWNASSNSSQAKLIIGKATLSVTEVNYSGVYDGLSHSSSITVTSANWDGKTIVSGTSTSYGTTVTSTGAVNSEYNLKTATNYTALTTIYYKITGGTNYNDYTDKVTFEISKASGSVSTAPTNAAVTYGSGSNLCSAGSGTGTMQYKLDSGSWSSTIPTATTSVSAGEHTLYYRAAESTNYSQSSEGSITVTVAQKGVTVSWGTITWPYDGFTHSTTCNISNGVISGTTCTVSLSGNSVGAAVGSKTVTATLSNDNYTISSGGSSKTLSITAKVVTLSWGELTWVYDGYTHSTTCSVSNLVSGDTCTVTLTGNSVGENVGTSTVTATSLSNTNYTLTGVASTDKSKTLRITQANGSGSVTMTGWTYGDTPTNPTSLTNTNGSVTYTWYNSSKTALSAKPTSTSAVGTYYVKATFAATTNYKAYTTDYVSFTISQKEVGLSWGTASWVYDGNTHSTTCTATGLVSGDTCTVTLTGNSVGKNVGTATVTASSLSNSNYKLPSSKTKSISITQKEVTLTWGTSSWAYDGSTHSTTCTAGNLVSGDTCTVTLSGNSVGKNVGSATVTATELSNGNYKLPSSKTKSISITARVATLTWGTLSWTYDGSAHSTTCSVSNLVSGDTCTVTLSGNSVGKNVGSATVTATALSNSNYTLTGASNTSKTLSVTAAAVTVPTPSNGGGVYNKTAYNATFPSVTGASITKYRWSTNGSSGWTETTTNPGQTNAGTIYVQAQYTADSNHSIGGTTGGSAWSSNATITVTQKEVTLTWGTASWTYDGNTHSTTCTAGNLVSGDTCTVTLDGNSVGKNVGSATVTASSLSNSNYKLPSSKTKTISITQKEVTLTWGTTTWTYDGSAHSTTCTAGNLVSGDTCTVTLDGNSVGKNVGSATVTATELSNSNYKLPTSGLSKTISITQKEVTLTWGTTTWTYDGSAHSTTCTLGGVVSGDTCTLTLGNNSITYVGSQTVTTSLSNTNYKLPSSNTKTISVTKRTPSITLSSVNKLYDGNKYYSYVTASDAKGTLYWKKGSAPTTSSYGGTVDVSSVGTSLGTNFPTAYVQNNADDCTLYWIFVPSSSATITSGQTYAANFNDSASGSVTMTITASAITIPTITAVEVTYDKAAHSLSFPAVSGASITKYQTSTDGSTWTDASPATTNPSLTNADTLYVRAYYTADSNHSGSGYTTGKSIKINQKAVTLSWGTAFWTYNGSAHSTTCSIASGVISGDSCTVSLGNNSITYVGSETVTASLSNSNYVISGASTKSISVTKATPTIAVSGVDKTYDNVDYFAYLTSSNVKGTVYWKKNSAPTTSSYDGYKSISSTGNNLNIDLGSVKLDADDHTLYWLVVPSSTANSLTTGHTYAENYNSTSGNVEMTIDPKPISIGSVTNGGGVYKGSNYYATFPSVTGAVITNYRYSTNGTSWTTTGNTTAPGQTNFGTLYVQAYYTAQSNYTGSAWSSSATISVTQKEVSLSWGTASWVYDGNTHSTTCTAGSLISGDTCTVTLSNNSVGKNVGSQTVTATGLSNSNYKLPSSKTKTISITAKKVALTWGTLTWVYNNATHSTTCSVSNLVSGDACTVTLTGNSVGPSVGTATVTASSLNNDNYTLTGVATTDKSKTLSITAADITYTNTSPVSEYCTATAVAATKTLGSVSISIASESATDYSGAAITSGSNPSVEGYTISQSGWSISSDGKTITVPANVAAGTYNITVTAAKPNHTSKANGISVQLVSVTLNNIELTLEKTTIPYGGSTKVASVTATYNNGATKDVKDDTNTSYSTNPTGIVTIS